MNKKYLLLIILFIAIIGLAAFSLWPKTELSEIKIAKITTFLLITQKEGFFEKEGFRVKLEFLSPEDSMSALLAGKIDYTYFFGGTLGKPFIEASLRNTPIKVIMLPQRNPAYYLLVQPKLELNNLKTIGINARYTTQHYLTLKFIEENNLELRIIAPQPQEIFLTTEELENLLLHNEVDAILTSPYSAFQLQTKGFSILDTLTDKSPSVLSVRSDKIEKNPEEIQKVIRALEQAMDFIVTEPEKTKELLLKAWDLEKTEENLAMIEEMYSLMKDGYDRTNVPYDEGAELLIQIVKAGEFETVKEVERQVVTQEELDKVFDFRFVK